MLHLAIEEDVVGDDFIKFISRLSVATSMQVYEASACSLVYTTTTKASAEDSFNLDFTMPELQRAVHCYRRKSSSGADSISYQSLTNMGISLKGSLRTRFSSSWK